MSGGKGGGSQTTTQTNTPWGPTGEQLTNIFGAAQNYFMPKPTQTGGGYWQSASTGEQFAGTADRNPSRRFGGGMFGEGLSSMPKDLSWVAPTYSTPKSFDELARERVASLDPNIEKAWGMQESMVNDPNSSFNRSINSLMGIAAGDYDPYTDRALNRAMDTIQARTNSQAGLAGRTGSGMAQDIFQKNAFDAGTTLMGQERQRQMQALGLMPAYSQLGANTLGEIGNQRMGYQQRMLDAPFNALQQYASLIQPGLGFGTQTSSQPVYGGNYGGLGALAGLGIGAATGGAGMALMPWMMGGQMLGGQIRA